MEQRFKKIVGILFIILGLAALLTPFTPGSWLIFVGLELIGIRFLFRERFSLYYRIIKTRLLHFFGRRNPH
jgi:uncharacterized protein YqgC (DUF456 family)